MKFNEFKADGSTLAVRRINRYADEIGKESMDYEVFKTAAEMLDKQMLKSLAQLLDDSDTAPREWIMKTIADHDPETFKKMYGDQEGYLSLMKPDQNLKDDNNESQPDAGSERADAARGMWASSKEIQSRFKTWQDFMNSEDFDEWLDDKFGEDAGEDKDVEKAKQIAKDKAGDMTGASDDIDKVKKGLSVHPDVADALKRANEELNRITKLAGLGEGADFYGYYKDPKDPEGKTFTYPNNMEFKTPHRSNANARMLLSRIGLDPDFENTGSHLIDDFIKATTNWLQTHEADKDTNEYDEVEMYHVEANRIKKTHPEVTHVGFN